MPTVLPEQLATSYAHDAASATVLVFSDAGPRPNLNGEVAARILLDATSHLVGVDLVPDSPDRLVVMLGPHDVVARTEDVRVLVEDGGRKVSLHGSAAKLVAPGASPYVP